MLFLPSKDSQTTCFLSVSHNHRHPTCHFVLTFLVLVKIYQIPLSFNVLSWFLSSTSDTPWRYFHVSEFAFISRIGTLEWTTCQQVEEARRLTFFSLNEKLYQNNLKSKIPATEALNLKNSSCRQVFGRLIQFLSKHAFLHCSLRVPPLLILVH